MYLLVGTAVATAAVMQIHAAVVLNNTWFLCSRYLLVASYSIPCWEVFEVPNFIA